MQSLVIVANCNVTKQTQVIGSIITGRLQIADLVQHPVPCRLVPRPLVLDAIPFVNHSPGLNQDLLQAASQIGGIRQLGIMRLQDLHLYAIFEELQV